MALNIRVEENRPFSRTVFLEGKLDNATAALLDAELETVIASPATVVVFDLDRLDYISSAGLRLIFRTRKAMAARAGKTLLINPRPQVKKVLEIANAVDFAEVFSSVEELDRYLDAMQRKISGGGQPSGR